MGRLRGEKCPSGWLVSTVSTEIGHTLGIGLGEVFRRPGALKVDTRTTQAEAGQL